jgi:GGDEF domain-containing protein
VRHLTSGWTDQHAAVALLFTVALVSTLAGLIDGGWVPVAVAVAALLAGLVALSLDVWGGTVVGLAAVAALVAVRRAGSAWTRDDFAAAAVEALALICTGAAAGFTGSRLRRASGDVHRAAREPTHGSLGLLGADAGMARLEEETRRARRNGRPVTLALLEIVTPADDLSAEERSAACRTAARIIESRAGEDDLPFALAENRVGIIFPEIGASAAWDAVGHVLEACATAEFTFGSERAPRKLLELAELDVGISQYGAGRDTWQTLLDAASEALARARDERGALGGSHHDGVPA